MVLFKFDYKFVLRLILSVHLSMSIFNFHLVYSLNTADISNASNDSRMRGIIIELPLKPRKKMVSLRLDEDVLIILDRFTAINGEVSRTLLLTKVVEALAKGLKETNYNASRLELKFVVDGANGGIKSEVNIVIPLKTRVK